MKYNVPYGKADEVTWGDTPYINGNPSTGLAGSIPPAGSIEFPQREIVNLIRDVAALLPDNADLHQLGRTIQTGGLNFKVDTGTANAYACNLTPAPLAYIMGLFVVLKIANDNTGPSVLNLNSLGNVPIVRIDGSPLVGGDLVHGSLHCLMFDGTNFQMVWQQSQGGVGGGQPVYLLAPRTLYVNITTGNDTYDGFSAAFSSGIHGPFKTLQRAANELIRYNLNGYNVTINVADGTYGPSNWLPSNGAGNVYINGNLANPGNVSLTNPAGGSAVTSYMLNQYWNGVKFSTSGATSGDSGNGIWVLSPTPGVLIQNCIFGPCVGNHIGCSEGMVQLVAPTALPILIQGSAWSFIACDGGRIVVNDIDHPVLNFQTAVNYTSGFVNVFNLGRMVGRFGAWGGFGNVTGQKFQLSTNSIINTVGSGVNYFPGTVAGSIVTGGQYI
jgi:hypothetical protein